MCGIGGIVGNLPTETLRASIEKMTRRLAHRGPDAEGIVVENGIADTRLKAWGLGSVSPIADNETPEGREKNRRVEFVVLYDEN